MGVLSTTPATWTTGEKVTAAKMTAEVHDAFTILQAQWATYTPTVSGLTLGNGSLAGRYNQVGKTITAVVTFSAGSTTTYSGALIFGLPVAPENSASSLAIGTAFCDNGSSATRQTAVAILNGGATVYILTGTANTVWSSTVPFTFGTGAHITFTVVYEAV